MEVNVITMLVTGATGNVGRAVIDRLQGAGARIIAGVRSVDRARASLGSKVSDFEPLDFAQFESLTRPERFQSVFLVRPPALADANKYFGPFLRSLAPGTRVVFLSVQGAATQTYLPHAKIEKLITETGLPHTFLRPSYFMENLTTTLWPELKRNKRIFLPSGNLKFNWVAVDDIAEIGAKALVGEIPDSVVTITNSREYGFTEIIDTINRECGTDLRYESPNVLRYIAYELLHGTKLGFVAVMLLLHYLPRFKPTMGTSEDFRRITEHPATSIETFVRKHCSKFNSLGSGST